MQLVSLRSQLMGRQLEHLVLFFALCVGFGLGRRSFVHHVIPGFIIEERLWVAAGFSVGAAFFVVVYQFGGFIGSHSQLSHDRPRRIRVVHAKLLVRSYDFFGHLLLSAHKRCCLLRLQSLLGPVLDQYLR